jgi:hypothetical protein
MHEEKYLKGTAAITDLYDADSDEDDPEVTAIEWCILSLGERDGEHL